jgi:hypothetical protein
MLIAEAKRLNVDIQNKEGSIPVNGMARDL